LAAHFAAGAARQSVAARRLPVSLTKRQRGRVRNGPGSLTKRQRGLDSFIERQLPPGRPGRIARRLVNL
jgi:hypothetical protein